MKTHSPASSLWFALLACALVGSGAPALRADQTPQPLPFVQNWTDAALISAENDWSFDGISDPVIALKGSATAAAPFLLLNVTTKGKKNIAFGYKLRDIDGSLNNAVQPVAFQYRVGTNTDFVDLAGAFAPDASTGPNQATLVTPIVVLLPAEANDQPHVQVRWITANAEGNDEWIGIAAITAIGDDINPPAAAPAQASAKPETNPAAKPVRAPRDPGRP